MSSSAATRPRPTVSRSMDAMGGSYSSLRGTSSQVTSDTSRATRNPSSRSTRRHPMSSWLPPAMMAVGGRADVERLARGGFAVFRRERARQVDRVHGFLPTRTTARIASIRSRPGSCRATR